MRCRCDAVQCPVNSVLVVVIPKTPELAREVDSVPEERAIQELARIVPINRSVYGCETGT